MRFHHDRTRTALSAEDLAARLGDRRTDRRERLLSHDAHRVRDRLARTARAGLRDRLARPTLAPAR